MHTAVMISENVPSGRRTCLLACPLHTLALGCSPNLAIQPTTWTQASCRSGPKTRAPVQLPGSSVGGTALGWLERGTPCPLCHCPSVHSTLTRELTGRGEAHPVGSRPALAIKVSKSTGSHKGPTLGHLGAERKVWPLDPVVLPLPGLGCVQNNTFVSSANIDQEAHSLLGLGHCPLLGLF